MKHVHGALANVCNADLDATKISSAADHRPVVMAQVYGAAIAVGSSTAQKNAKEKPGTWKQMCDHPIMRKLTWYITTKKACSYVNL
jgi:hypothetical protein